MRPAGAGTAAQTRRFTAGHTAGPPTTHADGQAASVTSHESPPADSASTSNELPSGKINARGLGNISRPH